jgi:hypothetical protein
LADIDAERGDTAEETIVLENVETDEDEPRFVTMTWHSTAQQNNNEGDYIPFGLDDKRMVDSDEGEDDAESKG